MSLVKEQDEPKIWKNKKGQLVVEIYGEPITIRRLNFESEKEISGAVETESYVQHKKDRGIAQLMGNEFGKVVTKKRREEIEKDVKKIIEERKKRKGDIIVAVRPDGKVVGGYSLAVNNHWS